MKWILPVVLKFAGLKVEWLAGEKYAKPQPKFSPKNSSRGRVCYVLMTLTYFDVFLKYYVNRKKWGSTAKKNNQCEMDNSSWAHGKHKKELVCVRVCVLCCFFWHIIFHDTFLSIAFFFYTSSIAIYSNWLRFNVCENEDIQCVCFFPKNPAYLAHLFAQIKKP